MEEKDLAKDMKREELLQKIKELQKEKREEKQNEDLYIKYYEECALKMGSRILKVSIAEINEKMLDENEEEKEVVTYDIYMKYKGQDVLIANIDETGALKINKEVVEKIDPENKLGLLEIGEQEKPDLSVLKELDGKTEEELEKEIEQKAKTEKEQGEEDDEEELEKKKEDEGKEEIAKKKNIPSKNVFILRKDSQFYKNYPQVPDTTYFYRDNDGKIKAEYIDKNGDTQPSRFFSESTTNLTEQVISLGDDADPIEKGTPYQVMTTRGLTNTNTKARDIRIAIYIKNGYMEFEEIREGYDGKWTGYELELNGRDYNLAAVNKLSDTNKNKIELSEISDSYEVAEDSGLAEDGVQLKDLNPRITIERFMDEGYNKEEATDIYNYMIGDEKLSEEAAKERVNEEIIERIERKEKEVEEDEKTPWGDAWNRKR